MQIGLIVQLNATFLTCSTAVLALTGQKIIETIVWLISGQKKSLTASKVNPTSAIKVFCCGCGSASLE